MKIRLSAPFHEIDADACGEDPHEKEEAELFGDGSDAVLIDADLRQGVHGIADRDQVRQGQDERI